MCEGDSDLEGLNPNALGAPSDQDEEVEEEGEESNSDEEDAELARLLESASGMVGKKAPAKGTKRRRKADSDDDKADEEEAYFYSDFFGPGGKATMSSLTSQTPAREMPRCPREPIRGS